MNTTPFARSGNRLAFLDNLRSFVILLVVVMHSNVTYSGLGGWYYVEGSAESLDLPSILIFGFYGSFTQAWFMGALFFVSGYFAAKSLARRGPSAFFRERLFRLGVPLAIYVFMISPFIGYALMNYDNVRASTGPLEAYWLYASSFGWLDDTGPLWFAEALIAFTGAYAAMRAIRSRGAAATAGKAPSDQKGNPPSARRVAAIIAVTGLSAFALRLVFPIGWSAGNLQLGYFAAYIALFALGAQIGETDSLEALVGHGGIRWFALSLGAGIPLWVVIMEASGAVDGVMLINGGLNWQSLAYSVWEAFVAVSMTIGIVSLFAKRFNAETRLSRFLSANAFGVFMLHAPVLISVSLALAFWNAYPLAKHVVIAPLAYILTLALSAVVRRIPPVARILR